MPRVLQIGLARVATGPLAFGGWMTELEQIKSAFDVWTHTKDEDYIKNSQKGPDHIADLFWPLLANYYARQADPKLGVTADEMRVVKELKAALGMELWAHEKSNKMKKKSSP